MRLINEYTVVDNFFESPKNLVEFAKTLQYYHNDIYDNSVTELKDINLINSDENIPPGKWKGYRTKNLKLIDGDLSYYVYNKIKDVICYGFYVDFDFESYFHITTKNNTYEDSWWHTDPKGFAGVVYLTENPPVSSGTILKNGNDRDIVIDNVFNRLLIYNSSVVHRPESCFGDNIDNSRLTLTFFIDNLRIRSRYINILQ